MIETGSKLWSRLPWVVAVMGAVLGAPVAQAQGACASKCELVLSSCLVARRCGNDGPCIERCHVEAAACASGCSEPAASAAATEVGAFQPREFARFRVEPFGVFRAPAGYTVAVDGEPAIRTPDGTYVVAAGARVAVFSAEGAEPHALPFTAKADALLRLEPDGDWTHAYRMEHGHSFARAIRTTGFVAVGGTSEGFHLEAGYSPGSLTRTHKLAARVVNLGFAPPRFGVEALYGLRWPLVHFDPFVRGGAALGWESDHGLKGFHLLPEPVLELGARMRFHQKVAGSVSVRGAFNPSRWLWERQSAGSIGLLVGLHLGDFPYQDALPPRRTGPQPAFAVER